MSLRHRPQSPQPRFYLSDLTWEIRKVALAEDDGDHVAIASGLKPTDKVIVSLPVDLTDGAAVAIRDMKAAAKPTS